MDNDTKILQEERTKLYYDFYQNIIPKRLPVWMTLSYPILATYAKENFVNIQYNFKNIAKAAKEICNHVYSDRCPLPSGSGTLRIASYFELLGAKPFKMSASGFIQHPEVSSMNSDDYDEFISDPYAFMLEKAIPRLYDNLNPAVNPVMSMMAISMADQARAEDRADISAFLSDLTETFGYTSGGPRGCMGTTEAAYDFLADLLRSFTGISMDIRRNKQKVKDACDSLYPLVFKLGLPPAPHFTGTVNIPIHMPPFMRPKDLAEVYYPTLNRMAENYAALGVRLALFCEGNCMQHIDIFQDLPSNLEFRFEYGDAQIIKDKLGDKFIIGGLYPIQLLDTGTEQQVIDKAKELLDIMMPGGGYLFSFDKGTNGHNTINLKNMNALAVYLRDHAVYDNAGQSFGKKLNCEGFKCDKDKLLNIKSKYSFNWEEFKKNNPYTPEFAQKRYQKYYDNMFNYMLGLLM